MLDEISINTTHVVNWYCHRTPQHIMLKASHLCLHLDYGSTIVVSNSCIPKNRDLSWRHIYHHWRHRGYSCDHQDITYLIIFRCSSIFQNGSSLPLCVMAPPSHCMSILVYRFWHFVTWYIYHIYIIILVKFLNTTVISLSYKTFHVHCIVYTWNMYQSPNTTKLRYFHINALEVRMSYTLSELY